MGGFVVTYYERRGIGVPVLLAVGAECSCGWSTEFDVAPDEVIIGAALVNAAEAHKKSHGETN
jgi:hypothetical protein